MKRFLDYVIFVGLIALIAIANKEILGISLHSHKEAQVAQFAPDLGVVDVLYSSELAPRVTGYGGVVSTAIGVDDQGVIKDIQILKNSETPEFFKQIVDAKYLSNWLGKNLEEAAVLKVDAVSGATMTSEGIAKTIQTTINAKLGKETDGNSLSRRDLIKTLSIAVIGIMGLLTFFATKKTKKFKTTFAVCSILVLGIWQGAMLSVAKISTWLLSGMNGYAELPLLLILLASLLIPFFTGKNFYCQHVCPFGAAQDLVTRSVQFKYKLRFHKALIHMRIAILIACFIMLLFGIGGYIASVEPFAAFKPTYAPWAAIGIFSVSLILSTFMARPWCKYFCPCGAFLDLFKRKQAK